MISAQISQSVGMESFVWLDKFSRIFNEILNDETSDQLIFYVEEPGSSTALRVKHVSTDLAVDLNENPVVLSHGIHSNLESWEDFGVDIANKEHRDVWLIELTGGPNQDEDCGESCPAYDFSDLKTDYWPALVAAVEAYSGKDEVDYVGYDLGCTTALESLESYSGGKASAGTLLNGTTVNLASSPVDTFVGVGCIGNFSPSSLVTEGNLPFFADYIQNNSDTYQDSSTFWYGLYDGHLPGGFYKSVDFVRKQIVEKGYWTLIPAAGWVKWAKLISATGQLYLQKYALFPGFESDTMSMKVYQDFIGWINDPNEPKPGLNVNLNNFVVIQSSLEVGEVNGSEGSDLFVSNKDQQEICNNVQSSNKYYVSFKNVPHFDSTITKIPYFGRRWVKSLANNENAQDVISDFIKNDEIVSSEVYAYNTNCDILE